MVSAAPERGQKPRELLDDGPKPPLEVRLYVPVPEVVVVRVSGQLDVLSVPLLIERAGQQFTRAPHVVIDLNDVTFQGEAGVQALRFLHRQAAAVGTHLHLAADQYSTVRCALQVAELDQLLPISSTAAAVVSRLVPACNNRAATRAPEDDPGASTTSTRPNRRRRSSGAGGGSSGTGDGSSGTGSGSSSAGGATRPAPLAGE